MVHKLYGEYINDGIRSSDKIENGFVFHGERHLVPPSFCRNNTLGYILAGNPSILSMNDYGCVISRSKTEDLRTKRNNHFHKNGLGLINTSCIPFVYPIIGSYLSCTV